MQNLLSRCGIDYAKKFFGNMTMLDGLTAGTINSINKIRYKHFGKKCPKLGQSLCSFGKVGIVKMNKDGNVGD